MQVEEGLRSSAAENRALVLWLSIVNLLGRFLWWGVHHRWNELFRQRTSLSNAGAEGAGSALPPGRGDAE